VWNCFVGNCQINIFICKVHVHLGSLTNCNNIGCTVFLQAEVKKCTSLHKSYLQRGDTILDILSHPHVVLVSVKVFDLVSQSNCTPFSLRLWFHSFTIPNPKREIKIKFEAELLKYNSICHFHAHYSVILRILFINLTKIN